MIEKIEIEKGVLMISREDLLNLNEICRGTDPQDYIILFPRCVCCSRAHNINTFFVVYNPRVFQEMLETAQEAHDNIDFLFSYVLKEKIDGEDRQKYLVLTPTENKAVDKRLIVKIANNFHTDNYYTIDNYEILDYYYQEREYSGGGAHRTDILIALVPRGTTLIKYWTSYKNRRGSCKIIYKVVEDLKVVEIGEMNGLPVDFEP